MIARLAAASLLALAAATPALAAEKGQPPITAQTASSGGPLTPEQKAVRFDTADLSFEVFPDREAIAGVATLDFTANAPVSRLVTDLDRNLPLSATAIDDKPPHKGPSSGERPAGNESVSPCRPRG